MFQILHGIKWWGLWVKLVSCWCYVVCMLLSSKLQLLVLCCTYMRDNICIMCHVYVCRLCRVKLLCILIQLLFSRYVLWVCAMCKHVSFLSQGIMLCSIMNWLWDMKSSFCLNHLALHQWWWVGVVRIYVCMYVRMYLYICMHVCGMYVCTYVCKFMGSMDRWICDIMYAYSVAGDVSEWEWFKASQQCTEKQTVLPAGQVHQICEVRTYVFSILSLTWVYQVTNMCALLVLWCMYKAPSHTYMQTHAFIRYSIGTSQAMSICVFLPACVLVTEVLLVCMLTKFWTTWSNFYQCCLYVSNCICS